MPKKFDNQHTRDSHNSTQIAVSKKMTSRTPNLPGKPGDCIKLRTSPKKSERVAKLLYPDFRFWATKQQRPTHRNDNSSKMWDATTKTIVGKQNQKSVIPATRTNTERRSSEICSIIDSIINDLPIEEHTNNTSIDEESVSCDESSVQSGLSSLMVFADEDDSYNAPVKRNKKSIPTHPPMSATEIPQAVSEKTLYDDEISFEQRWERVQL